MANDSHCKPLLLQMRPIFPIVFVNCGKQSLETIRNLLLANGQVEIIMNVHCGPSCRLFVTSPHPKNHHRLYKKWCFVVNIKTPPVDEWPFGMEFLEVKLDIMVSLFGEQCRVQWYTSFFIFFVLISEIAFNTAANTLVAWQAPLTARFSCSTTFTGLPGSRGGLLYLVMLPNMTSKCITEIS